MKALIIAVLAIVGFIVVGIAMALIRTLASKPAPPCNRDGQGDDEEALVRDMYRTVQRLENRVEVLETLLARHEAPQSGAFSADSAGSVGGKRYDEI